MSFGIEFVAVTRDKQYTRRQKDLDKGEVLELGFIESTVLGQIGAGKEYTPHTPTRMKVYPSPTHSGTMLALGALSLLGKIHVLEIGVMGLLMHQPGRLNIFVRHEHLFWPTTGENYTTYITASRSIRSIILSMFKFLDENDMGQWGPLLRICEGVGAFSRKDPGSNYIVNVTLTD